MKNQKHTPNDQRSIVKNSNNDAFQKDASNRVKVEELNSEAPPKRTDR